MAPEPRNFVRFCVLLLVVPVLAFAQTATPAPAQTTATAPGSAAGQEAPPPGAVLKVTTRLVLVDVVALDKKGLPVTDLKAEDFSLKEEGTGQQVRVFSFQQPAEREAGEASQPVVLPANTFTNTPTFKPTKTLSVILLDGLNTDVQSQKYARQEMLKFLEKLPAGQPVAVYGLGAKLRLLQDFTTDSSLLKQALAKAKGRGSPVLDNPNGGQAPPYLPAAIASAMTELNMDAMMTQIQIFQQQNVDFQTDIRLRMTLAALKSLAQTLSGYPGRKNLIWISAAFPAGIFTQLSSTNSADFRTQSAQLTLVRDYAAEIEQVSSALSNARVAVYPVDAATLVNHDVYAGNLSNTDSNGNYLGRTATGQVGGSGLDRRQAMDKELNRTTEDVMVRRTTMTSIADETGGKAFYNRNDLDKAIREGMEDGLTYYTLGYYPEDKTWNGRFRKIVLTVNHPDVKLRYRSGYFALDLNGYQKLSPQQQAMDLGLALSLDYPVSTALTFEAATEPPSPTTGNKVLIKFGINAHLIGFELQEDGLQHASVDCAVQAFNLKGEPARAHASTFTIALKPEQFQLAMKSFLPCNQSLELGPGDYVMRLGVRDNGSGLIGTANARVTVPPTSEATGVKPEEKRP
ncbi:MAG TPA: VWA domain-containing protein [Candidatus Angelobacter sp.]